MLQDAVLRPIVFMTLIAHVVWAWVVGWSDVCSGRYWWAWNTENQYQRANIQDLPLFGSPPVPHPPYGSNVKIFSAPIASLSHTNSNFYYCKTLRVVCITEIEW